MTPAEVSALSVAEYRGFVDFMAKVAKAQEEANRGQ